MKIIADNIDPDKNREFLNKNLAKIYLIYSEEILLINEVIDIIKKIYIDLNFDHEKIFINSLNDIENIKELFNNDTLFSSKRLFNITLNNKKLLQQIFDSINYLSTNKKLWNDVILLSIFNLDKNIKTNKLINFFEKNGIVIEIPKVPRKSLSHWIRKRLILQHQQVDENVCEWISEMVEGNLSAAYQELLKLNLIYSKKKLSSLEIEEVVLDSSKYTIYDLRKNILNGNIRKSIHIVQKLKSENESLPLLVWLLNSDIRTIDHNNDDNLFRVVKQNLSKENIYKISKYIHILDCIVKGIKIKNISIDPWDLLLIIIVSFNKPECLSILQ